MSIGAVWTVLKRHCDRDRDILETTEAGRRILEAVEAAPKSPDEPVEALFRR